MKKTAYLPRQAAEIKKLFNPIRLIRCGLTFYIDAQPPPSEKMDEWLRLERLACPVGEAQAVRIYGIVSAI